MSAGRTMREEQAFNDGRMAYREGRECNGGSRRSPEQRAAWTEGFEHERRIDLGETATDAQRAEAQSVLAKLKASLL